MSKKRGGGNTTRNNTIEQNNYRPDELISQFITPNETVKISQDRKNEARPYPVTILISGWNLLSRLERLNYQNLEINKEGNKQTNK